MEKKYYLVLVVIIIVVAGLGLFFINGDHVKLAGTSFKTPEGYKAISDENSINFTKGEQFIFIKSSNNTINSAINSYLKSKDNSSFNSSDFYLDGLKVYKVTSNNGQIVHFWFEKNHRVYEVFTWNYDESINMDIMNLIKSASS